VALGTYIVTAPIWPSATKVITSIPAFNIPFYQEGSSDLVEIESIGLREEIGEQRGIWFVKEPDFGRNVVIAGHRFLYSDPISPPFYFLDKVEMWDEITLQYDDTTYMYSVINKFEVKADATWIEKDYTFPSITLYTCTPLYNPVNRLVIVGKLVSIQ
jgi:LPXTG-site transpeptidase (sortase) family protein